MQRAAEATILPALILVLLQPPEMYDQLQPLLSQQREHSPEARICACVGACNPSALFLGKPKYFF